jgi:hypothetical protein
LGIHSNPFNLLPESDSSLKSNIIVLQNAAPSPSLGAWSLSNKPQDVVVAAGSEQSFFSLTPSPSPPRLHVREKFGGKSFIFCLISIDQPDATN